MYKLVALDMDGTLLNSSKEITPRTKQAIVKAREKGVKIVLASGRPLEGMDSFLNELGIGGDNEYVAYFNGSMVNELGSNSNIYQQTLDGKSAKAIHSLAKQLSLHCHAFSTLHGVITPKANPYTQLEATVNDISVTEFNFDTLTDGHPVIKAMVVEEEAKLSKAIPLVPEHLKEQFNVVRSSPHFLEFLNPKSSKGHALEAISQHSGIKLSEMIAIGDAENDNHMIELAGLGVAMGNAMESTKAVADKITLSNEQEGVAEIIEKYVL
ncbi:Cof-type HAD-IIB family hydrolase [Vibrio marisflavi]|uniref:Sugar phosphatase YidA n=1 Tax=Vibrio marisflavi CECT 7928 TaxID=634439 RepID=A0ABM9A4J1_9VIBR|nr:Cof-type HAD-IIB family hydrolase [Vibrio marisflavi]CAH0539728.1 Sugar phosphatase YidA [Vibrio marisflavi CECT 7928]